MIRDVFALKRNLALAVDNQIIALRSDFNVLRINSREFSPYKVIILVLRNIEMWMNSCISRCKRCISEKGSKR
jgi:hypothetical protein